MKRTMETQPIMYCNSLRSHHDPRRAGAALVIALAVLLVLLSIAITFALIVRYEGDMVGMAYEGARADALLDGALAKAMYRLNRDLDVHPDALSLDHGWRTWYNGTAFAGKNWTREQFGAKQGVPLDFGLQGLVRIDITQREQALAPLLNGGLLYVQFTEDRHMEPLFRGPRTEHWLHVPRIQGDLVVLYADPGEARLVNNAGDTVDDDARQNVGIFWFDELVRDNPLPFITTDFFYPGDPDNNRPPAFPADQVNAWADVDTTGDGMRDALWMPIARDVDHHGDWLDNTLDGLVDPWRDGQPLFESAPFVYREAQARFDYETGEWTPSSESWVGAPGERIWLTVPLPGMIMQIDLNSDGVFDERDHYCDEDGNCGPVYVRLPEQIRVPRHIGFTPGGDPITDVVILTRDDVDLRDNNYDLFVNSFRNYAYIGPHAPLQADQYQLLYHRNQIPATRAETPEHYDRWLPYEDITRSDINRQWLGRDQRDPLFAAAHHRAYHDINVNAAFGGPENLDFFFVDQAGNAAPIHPNLERILRQPNALRITCSGEPVSEIVGRAAIHITDEAGKANLNAAGGHVYNPLDNRLDRALHQGVSSFEYDTRVLPGIGIDRAAQFWGMRTGALRADSYAPDIAGDQYDLDAAFPGYGRVDDNGNALLLALSGRDDAGTRFIDDGLRMPRLAPLTLSNWAAGTIPDAETWAGRLYRYEREATEFQAYYDRLGRFEGIDEPQELRLFNPLRNRVAERDGFELHDRLLLRKEELTRHPQVSDGMWSFLRNLVTVNSDTRNIFAVRGRGLAQNFLKLDPNTATHQQLAATLLIKGDVSNVADGLWTSDAGRRFADGLRQFDRSYEGHLFGQTDGVFPADPVLQTMRLALDIVSARDRTAQRHRLVTENLVRNPHTYWEYMNRHSPDYGFSPPPEDPNERERILEHEVMPVGDVQEYLHDALGVAPEDKRLIAPDKWWKDQTGEDRLFQYAAASTDAIRINEVMVRPVRRVEAETQPLPDHDWSWNLYDQLETYYAGQGMSADPTPYALNLNPAPYPGMLSFDVVTPPPFAVQSAWPPTDPPNVWFLQSAYDSVITGPQPLLGERTAWTYTSLDPMDIHWPVSPSLDSINPDIIEFRFRASEGLPAGRYYLKVNVTDQFGNMSVVEPDILQYSIKYANVTDGENTISGDMEELLLMYAEEIDMGDPTDPAHQDILEHLANMINGLWQTVDKPEFIASPAARAAGSASPPGWVFLPNRDNIATDASSLEPFYQYPLLTGILDDIGGELWVSQGYDPDEYIPLDWQNLSPPPLWEEVIENYLVPWTFYRCPDLEAADPPIVWPFVLDYMLSPEGCGIDVPGLVFAIRMLRLADNLFNPANGHSGYFVDDLSGAGYLAPDVDQRTFTVIVPDGGYELCVAFRLNPEEYERWLDQDYASWLNFGQFEDPPVPQPLPPSLAINFFDFSQEPSHEYVELVNVTDEEVDLGGWMLEIGIPDPPGADAGQDAHMQDPYKSVWRVPSGVTIAPHGHLLLGFDVFDNAWGGGIPADTANPDLPMQGPLVGHNGMGLAAGTADASYANVTEPPIWDMSRLLDPAHPLYDFTGSVFKRDVPYDYVDNAGDGLSSAPFVLGMSYTEIEDFLGEDNAPPRDEVVAFLDTDNVLDEYRTHGDGDTIPPWSRIVQLENQVLWLENAAPFPFGVAGDETAEYLWRLNPYMTERERVALRDIHSVERLAQLVLRGGVLPNYPERDGIDNDGDGGYVTRDKSAAQAHFFGYDDDGLPLHDEALLRYVPGTLDKDMIDNNLDGMIDSRGTEVPMATPLGNIAFAGHGNPFQSEGVDEGRLGVPIVYNGVTSGFQGFLWGLSDRPRQYGPGSFEPGALPMRYLDGAVREAYGAEADYGGWPDGVPPRSWVDILRNPAWLFAWLDADWSGFAPPTPDLGFPYWATGVAPNEALPPVLDATDSPEWKAFVERRWNPGDNVIVTLYVGDARERRVADQITYREYDVINRTIDDIQPSPYFIDGFRNYTDNGGFVSWNEGSGTIDELLDRVCLDPARPTFWLPDHMGLDFYRSLERKHPLYHGDRFGLANRWTPTSGAYDDWAESLSVFEAREYRWNHRTDGIPVARFLLPDPTDPDPEVLLNQRLFGHAFWGSPLRKNTMARLWENPPDLGKVVDGLSSPDPDFALERVEQLEERRFSQFGGSDRVLAPRLFSGPGEQFATIGGQLDTTRHNVDYALRRARVPNRPFATLGEMLALPQLHFHEYLHQAVDLVDIDADNFLPIERLPRSLPNVVYAPRTPLIPSPDELPRPGDPTSATPLPVWRQDGTLLTATLAQAAVGGAKPPAALRDAATKRPEPLGALPLEVSAMNPTVLTVGQARVAPVWPGEGAAFDAGVSLPELYRWQDNEPSHMFTPVYLFGPPYTGTPPMELHWTEARYPRRLDSGAVFSLWLPGNEPLISPRYLFDGNFMADRLGYGAAGWPAIRERWPVRRIASAIATTADEDAQTPSDRAVMYVSRHRVDDERNRAEALFVWDRDSGLENGTYLAYVGTFIPGTARRLAHAEQMVQTVEGRNFLANRAADILDLDPELHTGVGTRRFDTAVALEFITDRRYAETLLPPGYAGDAPGLRHPYDWAPFDDASVIYRARDDGYIFYSADPHVQWRPIPVRVTNNYLALRVRNMGLGGQVACISHVVLAPAPRSRGQININTAETHRVVRGLTGVVRWEIELFNALMGLPAAINTFAPDLPKANEDIGLPVAYVPKGTLDDPWRQRWRTPEEEALLNALSPLPPPIADKDSPLLKPGEGQHANSWNDDREGHAMARLVSLIAGNRPQHAKGRYYTSLSELLDGISVGGVPTPEGLELRGDGDPTLVPAPWPLSNLGIPGDATSGDVLAQTRNLSAERYDEIMRRFSRLSNLTTTRSDVFEIIAVVQAGTVADLDGDGVMDYRGDEFYPQSETRARIIYDRRARTVRMDEAREIGRE